jgi:methionyl-tRNA synthetase
VSRVVPFVTRQFAGRIGQLAPEVQPLIDDIRSRIPRIYEAYERLESNRAVQEIVAIAEIANKYFQDAAPWDVIKQDQQAAQAICTFAVNCCRTVAALIKPILPRYAADVETILHLPPLQFADAAGFDLQDHDIGPFQRLVERVDPQRVAAMLAASAESLEALPTPAPPATIEELAAPISLEDFAKVDLRVATVLQAEHVEGADKLLRLRVDIGREQRTIFAGIRQSYRPEELVGKQVIVVANLQPRKMRFGVSEGMLLAAGPDSADVVVAEFPRPRQPGDRVR